MPPILLLNDKLMKHEMGNHNNRRCCAICADVIETSMVRSACLKMAGNHHNKDEETREMKPLSYSCYLSLQPEGEENVPEPKSYEFHSKVLRAELRKHEKTAHISYSTGQQSYCGSESIKWLITHKERVHEDQSLSMCVCAVCFEEHVFPMEPQFSEWSM